MYQVASQNIKPVCHNTIAWPTKVLIKTATQHTNKCHQIFGPKNGIHLKDGLLLGKAIHYVRLLVKFIKHNLNYYLKTWRFDLCQRPSSEEAVSYSVLPVLDTADRCRVKKAVVCMAQLVAAIITAHGLLSFPSDVYGLFDPSGKMLWLSVDHRRLRPVDDMVLLSCIVGESGFVMFC